MGQRVHAGAGCDERRETHCDFRVKNRIPWDQRKIVDGVFMSCFRIGDNGGDGCLTAGTGCSRNGDEKRQLCVYFQNAFHLCQRFIRAGNLYADSFGTVDAGAAAKSDDGGTVTGMIKRCRLINIDCRRICDSFIVDDIGDMILAQRFFQPAEHTEIGDTLVGDD